MAGRRGYTYVLYKARPLGKPSRWWCVEREAFRHSRYIRGVGGGVYKARKPFVTIGLRIGRCKARLLVTAGAWV